MKLLQGILIIAFPPVLLTHLFMWIKTKTWPFQLPDSELIVKAFGPED